jgi:hypothetical protein
LYPVITTETDRVISAREVFWSIVTPRSDDETEADDARWFQSPARPFVMMEPPKTLQFRVLLPACPGHQPISRANQSAREWIMPTHSPTSVSPPDAYEPATISLLRSRSFPVLVSREHDAYHYEKACQYLSAPSSDGLFSTFSLFFSLIARKSRARTVRAGLPAAPATPMQTGDFPLFCENVGDFRGLRTRPGFGERREARTQWLLLRFPSAAWT